MLKTVISAALLAATAAAAQAEGNAPARGPDNDPNEVVCVREAEIGSRLNRRRVCRTRAEWTEHRAQYKQSVERAQQQMQTQSLDPNP
ncbi:MAG TPA: hypothetical protein VN231_04775 [Allosphingosinicella sp.]|nr:hypothetical protein [Allosphingosinicella sp.]